MTSVLRAAPTVPPHELFRTLAALLDRDPSRRNRHAIAVLDVDGLTEINVVYGDVAGDTVLASVSDTLGHTLEPGEQAAWWAGDQCVVLLPGAGRRKALRRTRRIVARIAGRASGNALGVNVSAGVAAYPVDGITNSALVEVAAAALRRAKDGGRGRVRGSASAQPSRCLLLRGAVR